MSDSQDEQPASTDAVSLSDYLEDLRAGWRPLLATSLGLSSGMAIAPFVMNVLAPHVLTAMEWSKPEFALTAAVSGVMILSYLVIGPVADRFGVRKVGGAGILATSASYVCIALLDGPLSHYVAVLALQVTLGVMTTGPVFLRLVVGSFKRSRGIALAIAVSTPAVIAAAGTPLLSMLIEAQGWRFGSFTVALYCIVTGSAALALVPAGPESLRSKNRYPAEKLRSPVRELLSQREFRLLVVVAVLASMPLAMTNSQLALVLLENGLDMAEAGRTLALFALGTIVGRLLAGLALDRFQAEIVGAFALSLPAVGMLILASPIDDPVALALAILTIGLAFGAEGDLLAYLGARYCRLDEYGTALGALFASVGLASVIGAIVMSQSLRVFGEYSAFLLFSSLSVILGSLLLLRLSGVASSSAPTPANATAPKATNEAFEGHI